MAADPTTRNNKITIRKSRQVEYPTSGLSAGEMAYSYTTGSLYLGNSAGNGALEIGGTRLNQTFADIVKGYNPFNSLLSASNEDAGRKAGSGNAPSGGTAGLTLAAGLQMQKTPAPGTNNLEIATTEFVTSAIASSSTGVSGVEGLSGSINLIGGTGVGIITGGADSEDIEIFTEPTTVEGYWKGSVTSADFQLGTGLSFGITTDRATTQWGVSADNVNNDVTSVVFVIGELPSEIIPDHLTIDGLTADLINTTDLNISSGVTIGGDLTVNGTITTISTTNLEVEDAFVELANDGSNTDNDYGIFQQIGTSNYTGLAYDSSTSRYYLFESGSFDGTNAIVTTEAAGNMAQFRANLNGSLIDGGGF